MGEKPWTESPHDCVLSANVQELRSRSFQDGGVVPEPAVLPGRGGAGRTGARWPSLLSPSFQVRDEHLKVIPLTSAS
jgi:hypothetical protein